MATNTVTRRISKKKTRRLIRPSGLRIQAHIIVAKAALRLSTLTSSVPEHPVWLGCWKLSKEELNLCFHHCRISVGYQISAGCQILLDGDFTASRLNIQLSRCHAIRRIICMTAAFHLKTYFTSWNRWSINNLSIINQHIYYNIVLLKL